MGGMVYIEHTICLLISPMKIDLSKVLLTPTGKPVVELKRADNGRIITDGKGDPVTQNISMWSVVDSQVMQYSGGEGTKIRAIGDAMLRAYKKGVQEIEINADLVVFLREKVIDSAKMSDLFKEQIKDHLEAEEKAHVKPAKDKKKKEEVEQPTEVEKEDQLEEEIK